MRPGLTPTAEPGVFTDGRHIYVDDATWQSWEDDRARRARLSRASRPRTPRLDRTDHVAAARALAAENARLAAEIERLRRAHAA